ncbi:hypothetical protein EG329_013074 [Mollisiaceae sp. DMI_Dod_QoI]|nr:hypothetical protein EG329_013074 [Helotiales sp. DMI_Dod_QoI]
MTNSYPSGSPGVPDSSMPTGAPGFVPRRSSYASVVSGTASGAPFQQPARSGAFSHLLNQNSDFSYDPSYQSLSGQQRYDPRTYDMDFNTNGSSHGRSGSWGRGGHLHPFSSAFVALVNGNGYGGFGGNSTDQFFIPSYLKGSRYVQRLEEAHKAKVAAHKDGQSAPSSQPGSLSTSASSIHAKIGSSYRGITHDVIEKAPPTEDEALTSLPSKWNSLDKYGGLEVLNDGLEVKFSGPKSERDRDHEACAIRADHPMPSQCGIYYFEVDIVSRKREESSIGIGFSTKNVPLSRLPGWEPESYAYHGDDGHSFCCQSSGKHYGPPFNAGDVIGCGVNFRTGCAFFTKNGDHLGTAFRDIKENKGKLFPSVGMKKAGEHVRVNFGQRPFVFDIDGMMSASNTFPYPHSISPSDTPGNGADGQENGAEISGPSGTSLVVPDITSIEVDINNRGHDSPQVLSPGVPAVIGEAASADSERQRRHGSLGTGDCPEQSHSGFGSLEHAVNQSSTFGAVGGNTIYGLAAEETLGTFDTFSEAHSEVQRRQLQARLGSSGTSGTRPYIAARTTRSLRGYESTLYTWHHPRDHFIDRRPSRALAQTQTPIHANGQQNSQQNGHQNGHQNEQQNGQQNGHRNGHGASNSHTSPQRPARVVPPWEVLGAPDQASPPPPRVPLDDAAPVLSNAQAIEAQSNALGLSLLPGLSDAQLSASLFNILVPPSLQPNQHGGGEYTSIPLGSVPAPEAPRDVANFDGPRAGAIDPFQPSLPDSQGSPDGGHDRYRSYMEMVESHRRQRRPTPSYPEYLSEHRNEAVPRSRRRPGTPPNARQGSVIRRPRQPPPLGMPGSPLDDGSFEGIYRERPRRNQTTRYRPSRPRTVSQIVGLSSTSSAEQAPRESSIDPRRSLQLNPVTNSTTQASQLALVSQNGSRLTHRNSSQSASENQQSSENRNTIGSGTSIAADEQVPDRIALQMELLRASNTALLNLLASRGALGVHSSMIEQSTNFGGTNRGLSPNDRMENDPGTSIAGDGTLAHIMLQLNILAEANRRAHDVRNPTDTIIMDVRGEQVELPAHNALRIRYLEAGNRVLGSVVQEVTRRTPAVNNSTNEQTSTDRNGTDHGAQNRGTSTSESIQNSITQNEASQLGPDADLTAPAHRQPSTDENDDTGSNSMNIFLARVPHVMDSESAQVAILEAQIGRLRQDWISQEISQLMWTGIRANRLSQREKKQIRQEIEATSTAKLSPPLDETELVQALILQALAHDGYVETARAFAEEVHAEKKALSLDPNEVVKGFDVKEDEDAGHRQRIRTAVLEGDVEKALKYTNAYYPNVLKDNEHVYFRLRCRKFIEMVRQAAELQNSSTKNSIKKSNGHNGDWYDDIINHDMDLDDHQNSNNYDRMDTEDLPESQGQYSRLVDDTLSYGTELQAEFKDDPRREVKKGLDDIFALMAYQDPMNAKEVSHLLDTNGRMAVAEELNSAILLSLGKSSSAALERLYQQTYILLEDLREGGGPGSLVNIDDFIRPKPSP